MIFSSPSTVVLPEAPEKVQKFLTYIDNGIKFQLVRMRQNYSWKNRDPEGHALRLEQLKAAQRKSILMQDQDGRPYTYSGLWQELRQEFGWELANSLVPPEAKSLIPWANQPEHAIRYYQDQGTEALFANAKYGPCAVELPTGSGKSRIIEEICKRNPVQTTIITPSKNITNQLFEEMRYLFGAKYVGKFGDGRKDLGKLFTVCTGQSLTNIEEGTPAWDFFRKCSQFVWDESHVTAAATFESVALGVLRDASNRFFVSATQMRNDGAGILLKGITGPVVYRKDFKELVNEGYLARPFFKVFHVPAYGASGCRDAKAEIRNQLYLNPNVNRLAAEFAQKSVILSNRQTLILIEEFSQFLALRPYLNQVPYEFAHGGVPDRELDDNTDLKDMFSGDQWKPDIKAMIDRFNRGDTKLMVGTAAISTGMDTRPVGALVYLQGGTSEIKVKQSVGRGTRVTDLKKDVAVMDVRIVGSPMMERHSDVRCGIFRELGDVQEIVT